MLKTWMHEFVNWLRRESNTRAREAIAVLSDLSGEHYLNAVTARHLHSHGLQSRQGFWVRSEWDRTDLSYGVALEHFTDWDSAWIENKTGDIGQIEVKVTYTHPGRSHLVGKVAELSSQLEQRRDKDRNVKGNEYVGRQHYHGLIWLMDHGSEQEPVEKSQLRIANASKILLQQLQEAKLRVVGEDPFRLVARENLGALWPRVRGSYVGELRVALVVL